MLNFKLTLAFVLFSISIFHLSHADLGERDSAITTHTKVKGELEDTAPPPSIRKRRSFFDRTTTVRTVFKGALGILSVQVAGGQKAPEDPCNPSQNPSSTAKPSLINIKIPTFSLGRKTPPSTLPPECATAAPTTAPTPPPTPIPTILTEQPKPHSPPVPTVHTSPVPPSTSAQIISSSTVDPDQELIDSIFGEPDPTTAPNYGAGLIDTRKPLSWKP